MSFSTNAVQRRLSSQKLKTKHPTTPTADDLCYYHRSFGQAARKCTKPCSWSGKEQAIVAMAASHNTGLFFLWDKISGRQFLVDTGAEISVIPATASDKRNTHDKQGPLLSAANGTTIKTYGSRIVPLQFASKGYKWSFTIADVSRPLLEADFLRANSLLVDLKVTAEDIPKTAIITPFGLYDFLRMPFGLKNAAQTFQRLMDTVCQGLDFTFVYIDDMLVASEDEDTHLDHLHQLFQRLKDYGLVVNVSKLSVITGYPQPETVKALQEFVGMVNFYHRFIPAAAQLMSPLFEALTSQTKTLVWNDTTTQAFDNIKKALAKATLLAHPQHDAPISLTTDASDRAVGAILQQWTDESWEPVAFFSKKLRPPEQKYSAFDRELLALYLGIRHFRHFLEGRKFTAYTDHKPLIFCMSKVSEPWSNRQQRQLSYISEFTTDIQHIQGKDNPVADSLSRATLDSVQLGIDYSVMAADQKDDPEIQAYLTTPISLLFKEVPFGQQGITLLCDTSTGQARPVVPVIMVIRCQVVRDHTSSYHGLPPTSQRSGGKIPSPSEDVPTRPSDRSSVAQELPWVLLGICTAPKEDLGCSSAELVYGAPVTVPGEFFPAHTSQPNHNSELQRLREQVQALVPIPTSHHGITPISIPPDLQHSQYIFIRRDSHRTPLQRPYKGPFKVLQPGEKNFTIDIGGRKDTVSVDRLKPAHIEFQVPVAVAKHRG
ncbi:hypothetical protein EMCRGX_G006458 [Ephydatia muelleri]